MRSFDEYVSLGESCEVAFQIRRALGRDDSSFFSWKGFGPDAVLSILRARFHAIFDENNIRWDGPRQACFDASHGFFFHNPIDWPKTDYLIDKFYNPKPRRFYIYRVREPDTPEERVVAEDWGLELRDLLAPIHAETGTDFQIVVIMPPHWPRPADSDRLAWRTVRFFAPLDRAYDGDAAGWDRIFAEFPHREIVQAQTARMAMAF